MRYRILLITNLLLPMLVVGCNAQTKPVDDKSQADRIERIQKSDAEWKSILSKQEYYILRQAGTERAFSGDLWDHHEKGKYVCAACGLELFTSETKFDSGTGWPSYFKPVRPNHIEEREDSSYGWSRTEVLCARCQGHLGHVFKDGPKPTGLRYCINSASLDFIKD